MNNETEPDPQQISATQYLYSLSYLRHHGENRDRYEEFIVATSWEEAARYWHLEFQDQGVEVEKMQRHVPVITTDPNRSRQYPPTQPQPEGTKP
jgi:hypothetical protein